MSNVCCVFVCSFSSQAIIMCNDQWHIKNTPYILIAVKVRSKMCRLLLQQEVVRFAVTLCSRGNLFPILRQLWGNSVSYTDTLRNILPKQLLWLGKFQCASFMCAFLSQCYQWVHFAFTFSSFTQSEVLLHFALSIFKVSLNPSSCISGNVFI